MPAFLVKKASRSSGASEFRAHRRDRRMNENEHANSCEMPSCWESRAWRSMEKRCSTRRRNCWALSADSCLSRAKAPLRIRALLATAGCA